VARRIKKSKGNILSLLNDKEDMNEREYHGLWSANPLSTFHVLLLSSPAVETPVEEQSLLLFMLKFIITVALM
jgi:hypothetical protein